MSSIVSRPPLALLAIVVGLCAVLGALLVWDAHQQKEATVRAFREREHRAAEAKADEIERFFLEFYRSLRAISLIPPVRRLSPVQNRPMNGDSAVDLGWMTPDTHDTIQQFYNNLALAVPVSEIYYTTRGFSPEDGEVPYFMFDSLVLGGSALAPEVLHDTDFPEEEEGEEYAALVAQLQWFSTHYPVFSFTSLDDVPASLTGDLRTCDNTQYYSKSRHDDRDAHGHLFSVPVYREGENGELIGVLTAVFRANQVEALLVGVPYLIVTEADQQRAVEDGVEMGEPSRFALVVPSTGSVVADRRAPEVARQAANLSTGIGERASRVSRSGIPGVPSWDLVYLYDMAALETELSSQQQSLAFQLVWVVGLAIGACAIMVWETRHRRTLAAWVNDAQEANRALATTNHTLEDVNRALAHTNQTLRRLLDAIPLGVVALDPQGRMTAGASAMLVHWLGPYDEETLWADHLAHVSPEVAANWEIAFDGLLDGFLPEEMCIDQLPRRFRLRSQEIEATYVRLGDGDTMTGLLVVLADVTDRESAARAQREQTETLALAHRWVSDRFGLAMFMEENRARIAALCNPAEPLDAVLACRMLHTLKGEALFLDLSLLAECAHATEAEILERGVGDISLPLAALHRRWKLLDETYRTLSGDTDLACVRVPLSDFEELWDALSRAGRTDILNQIGHWRYAPAEAALQRLAVRAQHIARRLMKESIRFTVEGNGVYLDEREWQAFWSNLGHVVRNAVDHGIPAYWDDASYTPHIHLETRLVADTLVVSVADNGVGIDWTALAAQLARAGMPHTTKRELVDGLFADGVSTRTTITQVSGRGVGLAAVRAEVLAHGGYIEVQSTLGKGTTFVFRFVRNAGIWVRKAA